MPSDQNSIIASLYSGKTTKLQDLCALGLYMQKVEQYTDRDFSDYADVFWSFLGILKGLKDRFPQGYIWGLPYDHLDEALLWWRCCPRNQTARHILPSGSGTLRRLPIPSWCWIAKGYGVRYGECPGSSIVSRVKWYEPVRYSKDYDLGTSGEKLAEELQSSVFVGPEAPEQEPGLLDFALLHFRAKTSFLSLQVDPKATIAECHFSVPASILLPSGKDIGCIKVPESLLCGCNTRRYEFILLSINIGERCLTTRDADDAVISPEEQQTPQAHIMLIEWRKTQHDKPYAIRVALAKIEESAWNEVETTEKDIVLG